MRSRHDGRCKVTGRRYAVGAEITKTDLGWAIDDHVTKTAIEALPSATIGVMQCMDDMPHGIASDGLQSGDLVLDRDGQVVVVVTARADYYAEDGMCFGVMRDRGWVVNCQACPATAAEIAPVAHIVERLTEGGHWSYLARLAHDGVIDESLDARRLGPSDADLVRWAFA